jgi:hypothetical protein
LTAKVERFFFGSDNSGHDTWQLVPWIHRQGATEFSVNLLRVDTSVGPSPFIDAFEDALGAFRLPEDEREHLESGPGGPKVRPCPLWRLTEESMAILQRHLPDGLVAPPTYSTSGWLENPRFYRDGELVLGVITHEGGGLVRLEPSQVGLLDDLSIAFRDTWEWIG